MGVGTYSAWGGKCFSTGFHPGSGWAILLQKKRRTLVSAKETTVVLLDKRPTAESKSFDSPRSSQDGGPMQGVRGRRREYVDPCKLSTQIICSRDAGGTARTKTAGKPPSQEQAAAASGLIP